MPLHEYLCTSCGRTFEAIQSFGEAPLATCNRCSGVLKRLISAPAVQFKGTGWYVTDYAGKGSTDRRASDEKREKGDQADKADKPDKPEKPDKGGKGSKTDSGKKRSSKD